MIRALVTGGPREDDRTRGERFALGPESDHAGRLALLFSVRLVGLFRQPREE